MATMKKAPHKLSVVFCWHMHQPFYRDAESGSYALPWVYLHAMKDYTDMAAILDQVPGARAVVNFVPSLMAQIEDYAKRIRDWLDHESALPDPLLTALVHEDGCFTADEREWLLETCFRLNHGRNLHRYPSYSRLWHLAEQCRHHDGLDYLGDNYFTDLACNPSVRKPSPCEQRVLPSHWKRTRRSGRKAATSMRRTRSRYSLQRPVSTARHSGSITSGPSPRVCCLPPEWRSARF